MFSKCIKNLHQMMEMHKKHLPIEMRWKMLYWELVTVLFSLWLNFDIHFSFLELDCYSHIFFLELNQCIFLILGLSNSVILSENSLILVQVSLGVFFLQGLQISFLTQAGHKSSNRFNAYTPEHVKELANPCSALHFDIKNV